MKRTGRAEASPLCAVPQKASAAATDLRTLLVSRSSSIGCYTALGAHAVVLAVAVDGAMAALIGAALVPARAGGGRSSYTERAMDSGLRIVIFRRLPRPASLPCLSTPMDILQPLQGGLDARLCHTFVIPFLGSEHFSANHKNISF